MEQLSHSLQLNETNIPAAVLLKAPSSQHDKCCGGANSSQADDDPHLSSLARVPQSTCRADGWEWLQQCAHVRGAGIVEEGRQQNKYLQGEESASTGESFSQKRELSLRPRPLHLVQGLRERLKHTATRSASRISLQEILMFVGVVFYVYECGSGTTFAQRGSERQR